VGEKGGGGAKGGEMTQTLYTHMNKRNLKKLKMCTLQKNFCVLLLKLSHE
jgi:hypothetical protein